MPTPPPAGTRTIPPPAHKFIGNLLVWPTTRTEHSFRVRVVEPSIYSPAGHADIFYAAITSLVSQPNARIGASAPSVPRPQHTRFDLLTFPEAFLVPVDLLVALRSLAGISTPTLGCIHVGLRASADPRLHLFSTAQLRLLLADLMALPLVAADLAQFDQWLQYQAETDYFNVGCLFTKDRNDQLRVCLHPKMVSSKYEISMVPGQHMKEGNLLTLVTLQPSDYALPTVTIQPLLCSDALSLGTVHSNARPMHAANHAADCFGNFPPDHIDIVSVATHTPQQVKLAKGSRRPVWHEEFSESFLASAKDDTLARHRHALFVLSNFRTLHNGSNAGLSGAFIPTSLRDLNWPPFVSVRAWGRPKDSPEFGNEWYFPGDDTDPPQPWSSRAYVASLSPPGASAAYMLEFTIHRLPRDAPPLQSPQGLVDFKLHAADHDADLDQLAFRPKDMP